MIIDIDGTDSGLYVDGTGILVGLGSVDYSTGSELVTLRILSV